MSLPELVVFVLGPIVLAFWSDLRLGERRPATLVAVGVYATFAAALCALVGTPLASLTQAVAGGRVELALFAGIAFLCLTCGFLAGIWLLRFGAAALEQRRR